LLGAEQVDAGASPAELEALAGALQLASGVPHDRVDTVVPPVLANDYRIAHGSIALGGSLVTTVVAYGALSYGHAVSTAHALSPSLWTRDCGRVQ
jgi:hypothetical protein